MPDPRPCANPACDQTFTPRRSDARYCNSACRAAASRLRTGSDRPARAVSRVVSCCDGWPRRALTVYEDGREKRSLTFQKAPVA